MNHDREEAARQQQATETMLRMRDPKSGDIRDALRERNAAERELSCRDALIRDHLAKIMHLENRVDAEAHRAEHAEAQLEDMRACAEDWSVQANRMAIEAAKAEAKLDATVAVLKRVQWDGDDCGWECCPVCKKPPSRHAPDCVLAAALGSVTLPATPIASGHAGERETIRAAEIEATAKKIYEGFAFLPGYVPWTVRGNSEKQEEARHLARRALATRDTGSAP